MYRTMRRVELTVGLLTLVALILVGVGSLLLLQEKRVFEDRFRVLANFDNARGLRPGAPIWLSGIEVGSVQSVVFNAANQAEVSMSIRTSVRQRIHKDAAAKIANISLVGSDTMVALTAGTTSAPIIELGDYVETVETVDIAAAIDELRPGLENFAVVLENLETITKDLSDPSGGLKALIDNAAEISKSINEGEGALGALVNDEQLRDRLVKSVDKADSSLDRLQTVAANLETTSETWPEIFAKADNVATNVEQESERISEMIADAGEVVKNVRKASDDVPEIVATGKRILENTERISDNLRIASGDVPELVRSGQEGVDEVTDVVKAARSVPIIGGYLSREKPQQKIIIY